MSEFKLTMLESDQVKLAFVDCDHAQGALVESVSCLERRVWIGLENHHKILLNQEMVKRLLPYLQEFVETGHFGRRPIYRAFADPRIEKLAESDPLLASVRQHILHVADDEAATVRALVRLLMAYSEVTTEAVLQATSLREGPQDTVFAGIKNPLGGDDGGQKSAEKNQTT